MPVVISAIIQGRASLSLPVDLTGVTAVVGLIMPQFWTPAVVTVQGSPLGVNFYDLFDGFPGVELSFNIRPWGMVNINPNRLRCCTAIKLRSGTRDAPVAQAVQRVFGIIVEGDTVEQVYPTPFEELSENGDETPKPE